ncbi:MAG: hypothetical protein EA362_12510 [Saprospirales bacterium]|nr:MAG: hypothetical protein EA362_12510 [Saprospirales bacterium]
MDRNLGASQVATSSDDEDAYGDLYQWGRFADGHQCRNSSTTTTLSSGDQPGHGDFILSLTGPMDWRDPQESNLWQGVNGVNNPCPDGFRLPTDSELNEERLSWVDPQINSSNNAAGAFASPLKMPMAGNRSPTNGSVIINSGLYWSSTFSGTVSRRLLFFEIDENASMNISERARGFSVRCIKD